jgi:hypothetical protein
VTTKRHVARKSHRHERNDAYARYYDPGRNASLAESLEDARHVRRMRSIILGAAKRLEA